MAEFKDTPSGGMEVMQDGVWTTVPSEAASTIRRLRDEVDILRERLRYPNNSRPEAST